MSRPLGEGGVLSGGRFLATEERASSVRRTPGAGNYKARRTSPGLCTGADGRQDVPRSRSRSPSLAFSTVSGCHAVGRRDAVDLSLTLAKTEAAKRPEAGGRRLQKLRLPACRTSRS